MISFYNIFIGTKLPLCATDTVYPLAEINCFWSSQSPFLVNLHRWGLAKWDACECGQQQITNYIVNI